MKKKFQKFLTIPIALLFLLFISQDIQAQRGEKASSVVDQIIELESKMNPAEMPSVWPVDKPFATSKSGKEVVKSQENWIKGNPQAASQYLEDIKNALASFPYNEATMTADQKKLYKLYKLEYHFLHQQLNNK